MLRPCYSGQQSVGTSCYYTLQLTITWYKIHHANESRLRKRISKTKRLRSVNIYLYFFLLYKHQCFTGISATEKSHIFSHVKIWYFYSQSEVFFCCYNNMQFWAGIVWRAFCHSLLYGVISPPKFDFFFSNSSLHFIFAVRDSTLEFHNAPL